VTKSFADVQFKPEVPVSAELEESVKRSLEWDPTPERTLEAVVGDLIDLPWPKGLQETQLSPYARAVIDGTLHVQDVQRHLVMLYVRFKTSNRKGAESRINEAKHDLEMNERAYRLDRVVNGPEFRQEVMREFAAFSRGVLHPAELKFHTYRYKLKRPENLVYLLMNKDNYSDAKEYCARRNQYLLVGIAENRHWLRKMLG
jgi:hypothetical protein